MSTEDVLTKIIVPFVVAIIVAIVSYRFGRRGYRIEQREKALSQLVAPLHNVRRVATAYAREFEGKKSGAPLDRPMREGIQNLISAWDRAEVGPQIRQKKVRTAWKTSDFRALLSQWNKLRLLPERDRVEDCYALAVEIRKQVNAILTAMSKYVPID